jgi:hypothetical protein
MKRVAQALAPLAFWLMTAVFSFSQNQLNQQPCPDEDAVGCEPIAWSQLQEPAPLPDAASPPDRSRDQERPASSSELRRSDFEARHGQSTQTVQGVVIKDQGKYCVRVSADADFVLDDQQIAERYAGEPVRIEGVVDNEKNTLHIKSITPVS